MKRFQIGGNISVSCWTTVEAETAEEAIQIAKKREVEELNERAGFSYSDSEYWHHSSDGVPFGLIINSETEIEPEKEN